MRGKKGERSLKSCRSRCRRTEASPGLGDVEAIGALGEGHSARRGGCLWGEREWGQ